jgi:hypothetical protein
MYLGWMLNEEGDVASFWVRGRWRAALKGAFSAPACSIDPMRRSAAHPADWGGVKSAGGNGALEYAYVDSEPLTETDERGLDNPSMGPYWGPQVLYNGSKNTLPTSPTTEIQVLQLENCLGMQLIITGGGEDTPFHYPASRGGKHGQGNTPNCSTTTIGTMTPLRVGTRKATGLVCGAA